MACGPCTIWAGFPSSQVFGVGGQSHSNLPASTVNANVSLYETKKACAGDIQLLLKGFACRKDKATHVWLNIAKSSLQVRISLVCRSSEGCTVTQPAVVCCIMNTRRADMEII